MTAWVFAFDNPPEVADEQLPGLLGGKGAGLARMTRAGLAVPPGFTLSAECCAHFLKHERWPDGLAEQVRDHLARLEEITGRGFGRGKQPLLVSVRSGAAVSMPGMMDTLLNCGLTPGLAGDTPRFWRLYVQFVRTFVQTVAGITDEALAQTAGAEADQRSRETAEAYLAVYKKQTGRAFPTEPWDLLIECINAVFRSWNRPRAVAYRRRHDIRGLVGTALTVQAMFPSQVSGVLFTQDPNDIEARRIVIEASYGLGEAIVSGDVTPDRFAVKRDDFSRIQTTLGAKAGFVAALGAEPPSNPDAPSLNEQQIAELCALALRVEKHFGRPLDLEWGLADGEFALLQARPIRGLDVLADVDVGRRAEIERLRRLCGGARRVWVIHNLAETARAPTPLTWDILRRFMSGGGGFGRMYRDFGYRPTREVLDDGFLELICGRVYADPERLAQLFWDGMPLTYGVEAIVQDRRVLDRAPSRFDPERLDGRFFVKLPGAIRAMLRSARLMKRLRREAKARFEQDALPPYLEYVRRAREQDLGRLSTGELISELDARRRRVLDEFGAESLKPGFFGGLAYDALETMLRQLMGDAAGAELARTLTLALDGDTTFEQDALLHRLATVKTERAELPAFLERFGHRAAGEMELRVPRWREDTGYLEQIIEQVRRAPGRSPEKIHRDNLRRRAAAEQELPQTLAAWGGSCFREELIENLRDARALLPYREAGKHYLMLGYELLRLVTQELDRRWELDGGVYFLRLDELARFDGERDQLKETLAARKLRWQSAQRLELPDVIDSHHLDQLGLAPPPDDDARELNGDAISSGVATGPACIVFDPREADVGEARYVLVCPSTDPGWTPLFLNACALIVERGGVLSHGAIVARDFGIPAVVCPGATRRIAPGQEVRVDGNRGQVILPAEAATDA